MSTDRRRNERRARMPAFRYPDRRTGFDRRAPTGGRVSHAYAAVLQWYRRRPAALAGILALILTLNATDLALTLRALDGGAVELNPVMARMFAAGAVPAAAFKLGLGTLVAVAIWKLRGYRRILELSVVVLGLLGALVAYHLAVAAIGPGA